MSLRIAINDKQLMRYLDKMGKRSTNMRPLMARYFQTIHKEVMMNFRTKGSFGDILSGKPSNSFRAWKSLSRAYRAKREAEGTGSSILELGGELKRSMGSVKKITRKGMEYGTSYGKHGSNVMMHFGSGKKGIRPKKAKYLTLPFPGVKGTARDYNNTFVKSGVIFQRRGSTIVPLFTLKKKVVVPARPYLTIGNPTIKKMAILAADYITDIK